MRARLNFSERRRRLRRRIAEGPCLRPAPVSDPVFARLAEMSGFDCGLLAGSMASLSVLGAPDLVLLTLDELTEQTRRICRASDLSLIVDADHGYGNALNVMRTVQELEAAGAAALTIEDTALPRPFGSAGAGLVSLQEGLGKIGAALAARSDPALMIMARTFAGRLADREEALERIRAYDRSGADALFLSGVESRALVEEVAATTSLPLCIGSAGPEVGDAAFLRHCGVRLWIHGPQPILAAMQAAQEAMAGLAADAAQELPGAGAARQLLAQVVRDEDFAEIARRFLAPEGASRSES